MDLNVQEVSALFGPEGALAAALPGYEPRAGQVTMAAAVAEALTPPLVESDGSGARLLVVEAETGIGKTLAYLIPALLSGRRVVVSTATLNLQDQIIHKDIPLVAQVLGQEIRALCVKGRDNYLCLHRYYQYRSSPQLPGLAEPWLEKIDRWLAHTDSGDRAELDWLADRSTLWPRFAASATRCLGGDCPEAAECFLQRLRRKAGAARLLIVNHHLFFSDLALRAAGYGELLPRYEAVIFDEAHHLENVATTFFGKSFSHYQLLDLLTDIDRPILSELPEKIAASLTSQLTGLGVRLSDFTALFPGQPGRFPLSALVAEIGADRWREAVSLLVEAIRRLAASLAQAAAAAGEPWSALARRAEEMAVRLAEISLNGEGADRQWWQDAADEADGEGRQDLQRVGEVVRWYEQRDRAVLLSATPVDIAPELQQRLYATLQCCVLTSATLSSGGSFAYIRERLGLGDEALYLRLASPFDYPGRTLLYVPEADFPEPGTERHGEALARRVVELIRLSRGRALVLCTSLRAMEALAAHLEEHLPDYPLLVQGRASRHALLEIFRAETDSVLLAVASFWEGVDIAGEALSCLIIDKLPFEVPSDPVIQARIARINRAGGKPFFAFQVPRAILTLRQGVGRLMRCASDRGLIAILDVRLFSKGYGSTFRRSLPASPLCRDMAGVAEFFQQLDGDCPPSDNRV